MGVLTPQLLVCGRLVLFLFILNNMNDVQSIAGASPTSLATTIAPPQTATGNNTENVTNLSSYSTYNETATTQNNLTTPTASLGSNQSNATGSTVQPNTTTNAQTTQSATSSTFNISSTVVTSTDNSTRSSNGSATSSTTAVIKSTAIISTALTRNSSASFNESQDGALNNSEKSLTILFSILLGVIILVILGHFVYKFGRNKERSVQYTHRRLQNEDTGEPFAMPDDTLVISGGLYDGPQIYNPTMTVQNEELQTDASGFASRPTQFRLEFLREDQDRAFDHDTSTFQTFHEHDQEP